MSNLQFRRSVNQLRCAVSTHLVRKEDVEKLCNSKQKSLNTTCERCNYPLKLVVDENDPTKYHVVAGLTR